MVLPPAANRCQPQNSSLLPTAKQLLRGLRWCCRLPPAANRKTAPWANSAERGPRRNRKTSGFTSKGRARCCHALLRRAAQSRIKVLGWRVLSCPAHCALLPRLHMHATACVHAWPHAGPPNLSRPTTTHRRRAQQPRARALLTPRRQPAGCAAGGLAGRGSTRARGAVPVSLRRRGVRRWPRVVRGGLRSPSRAQGCRCAGLQPQRRGAGAGHRWPDNNPSMRND